MRFHNRLALATLAIGMTMAGQATFANAPSSPEQTEQAAVALSRLALDKTTSHEVGAFAQQVLVHHAAGSQPTDPAPALDQGARGEYQQLARTNDYAFDRQYMDDMVGNLREQYQQAPKSGGDAIALRSELARAEQVDWDLTMGSPPLNG